MSPFWGQFERDEITEEETLQGFASENVKVAKLLGFEGIVYTTYESLTTELEQFGVRIGNAWSNAV